MPKSTPWKGYRKFAFPALWAIILGLLYLLRETLAPFIGALLIAYLLAPLVRRLSQLKVRGRPVPVPRWVAVVSIYLVLGLLIWVYGMVAVPRISNEFGKLAREGEKLLLSLTPDKIEEYTYRVKEWFEESGLPVRIVTPHMVDSGSAQQAGFVIHIDEVIRDSVAELTESLRRNFFAFLKVGPKFAVSVFRNILMTFLILMVAGFLLVNPDRVLDYFRSLFPNRFHEGYQEICQEIDAGLSGVVRGQVLICLVNGVLTFIGLLILGVKYPVMLSTLAAVMSLIPIFGSILSSIPIVAVALTSSIMTGVGTLAWIIGIHLLEANLLNPKIIGETARIHPALVIFALVVGEHFYGLVGALFAVPIASVGLAFFRVLHRRAIKWNQEAQAGESLEPRQADNQEQPGSVRA